MQLRSKWIDNENLTPEISLVEYYDVLNSFDWYYVMSEDHGVWKSGEARWAKIYNIAIVNEGRYMKLLNGFRDYYNSGQPWGTERQPKPERPKR